VASNARRLLTGMRGIAEETKAGECLLPIRRHTRIREMSRKHVIVVFTVVILQGETVLYSYGKCPRYIVAIAARL
jgi:hypothetical protein